jgi:hypothetical protein
MTPCSSFRNTPPGGLSEVGDFVRTLVLIGTPQREILEKAIYYCTSLQVLK